MSQTEINVGDIVLLKNNKWFDRKRGKFSQKWLSPYTVMSISDKGVATLKNASVVTLNNKYNIIQLKNYIQGADDNQGIITRRNCWDDFALYRATIKKFFP